MSIQIELAVEKERKRIATQLMKHHLYAEDIAAATKLSIFEVNQIYEDKQRQFFEWVENSLNE